jgi:hypothetical protein
MANGALNRPALDQTAELGALYDARSDTFLSLSETHSLFKQAPSPGAVEVKHCHSTDVRTVEVRTFKEKCAQLGVDLDLGASILAGLVPVKGCARYLAMHTDTRAAHTSVWYSVTTVEEELNLASPGIKESLAFSALDTDIATHVVVGIRWGANYVVCPKTLGDRVINESRSNAQVAVEMAIKRLGQLLGSPDEVCVDEPAITPDQQHNLGPPNLSIFGDALPMDIPPMPTPPFPRSATFFNGLTNSSLLQTTAREHRFCTPSCPCHSWVSSGSWM